MVPIHWRRTWHGFASDGGRTLRLRQGRGDLWMSPMDQGGRSRQGLQTRRAELAVASPSRVRLDAVRIAERGRGELLGGRRPSVRP